MRTMRTDAEANGPEWAAARDPRVTRVGRWLRLSRIDELPQLLNVVEGTMSLIGPRPERPHFVEQLLPIIPHYVERLSIRPGITGWAQVNYPYSASIADARQKLVFDLYYLKHRSFALDMRILVETMRVVLTLNGAR
jgi:lipopolysaccharide/colanic/teichoic acid biosynthesis glycosyltransferase